MAAEDLQAPLSTANGLKRRRRHDLVVRVFKPGADYQMQKGKERARKRASKKTEGTSSFDFGNNYENIRGYNATWSTEKRQSMSSFEEKRTSFVKTPVEMYRKYLQSDNDDDKNDYNTNFDDKDSEEEISGDLDISALTAAVAAVATTPLPSPKSLDRDTSVTRFNGSPVPTDNKAVNAKSFLSRFNLVGFVDKKTDGQSCQSKSGKKRHKEGRRSPKAQHKFFAIGNYSGKLDKSSFRGRRKSKDQFNREKLKSKSKALIPDSFTTTVHVPASHQRITIPYHPPVYFHGAIRLRQDLRKDSIASLEAFQAGMLPLQHVEAITNDLDEAANNKILDFFERYGLDAIAHRGNELSIANGDDDSCCSGAIHRKDSVGNDDLDSSKGKHMMLHGKFDFQMTPSAVESRNAFASRESAFGDGDSDGEFYDRNFVVFDKKRLTMQNRSLTEFIEVILAQPFPEDKQVPVGSRPAGY